MTSTNRLAQETSPYLRQHADNPVDWYPWGPEAFEAARISGLPIFLSIGYSACHWCHVMAHESFEDEATAAVMNRLFINVKVDREERPDVDSIYMDATQAIAGRGGWPMSVWLRPDGRPFYAGTYFPPTDRPGMPSFVRLCESINEAWTERRADVDKQATQLTASIGRRLPVVESNVDNDVLTAAHDGLLTSFDRHWGGFGTAPKFPPAQTLMFLCRRYVVENSPETLNMITTTLDAMAAGGMYDQIGGGFSRYSVDNEWLIPHFEKMLYDNALLARAYTHGWLVTKNHRYAKIVEETFAYALRDLSDPQGGFYSAEDADSEGVEGKFYAWSLAEVNEACGADADAMIAHFALTEGGNFVDPHTGFSGNVLSLAQRGSEPDAQVSRGRASLFARRAERARPGLDDKVLTSWNALMCRALAEAGWVFGRPEWTERARHNAEFLWQHLRRGDGRVMRSWQSDSPEARFLGYCEDYAALLEALLTLAETDDIRWLERAHQIADEMIELFADPEGGFFSTGTDAESLIVRPQDFMDNATPSANSMAAVGLLRLSALLGVDSYEEFARATVARFAPLVGRAPSAFGYATEAIERLLVPPVEVAIIGDSTDNERIALERVLASRLIPGAVMLHSATASDESPLLANRNGVDGHAAAYVCERYACETPTADPITLGDLLDRVVKNRGLA